MVKSQVLTEKERVTAAVFDALGEPNRFRLFKLLLRRDDFCVSDLARELEISVPAVSQQLKILERAGLILRERRGQMICYRVRKENPIVKYVLKLTT